MPAAIPARNQSAQQPAPSARPIRSAPPRSACRPTGYNRHHGTHFGKTTDNSQDLREHRPHRDSVTPIRSNPPKCVPFNRLSPAQRHTLREDDRDLRGPVSALAIGQAGAMPQTPSNTGLPARDARPVDNRRARPVARSPHPPATPALRSAEVDHSPPAHPAGSAPLRSTEVRAVQPAITGATARTSEREEVHARRAVRGVDVLNHVADPPCVRGARRRCRTWRSAPLSSWPHRHATPRHATPRHATPRHRSIRRGRHALRRWGWIWRWGSAGGPYDPAHDDGLRPDHLHLRRHPA
ncbi:MAG: hypothetical protein JWO79_4103 [Actinomycetia bacterium]|nr:hypothetical protein [Actinomycetes bacterium]